MSYPPVVPERFWAKVDKDAPNGCWEWVGMIDGGYGQVRIRRPDGRQRSLRAHRVSWEMLRGPIPDGLQIDHLCRNRACVNPDHLEPVTHAENQRRGFAPPAINARKTHCPRGHEYNAENTRYSANGRRICGTCKPPAVNPTRGARRDPTLCAKRLHPWPESGTEIGSDGKRRCAPCARECRKLIARRRRARQRAAGLPVT